jgi:hypothetical protein
MQRFERESDEFGYELSPLASDKVGGQSDEADTVEA